MLIRRIAAVVIAAGTLVMSACAAPGTESPGGIDTAFEDMGGFTVTPIPPAEVLGTDRQVDGKFDESNAAEISENGNPILRVMVGQVNSSSGEEFAEKYLSELSAMGEKVDPPKVLASGPPQDIGGYSVRYFHMFGSAEGYVYADGPTVVIADQLAWGTIESVQDALVKILNNVDRP